jgi:hypothetical protein
LPVWNPVFKGRDATTKQWPGVECGATDLANPATEQLVYRGRAEGWLVVAALEPT